ncbi:MAG: methylglyoxal synthase, partial [Lachnospiraceae bacterium]
NNLATADFMLHSPYMSTSYKRRVENFNKTIQDRVKRMK